MIIEISKNQVLIKLSIKEYEQEQAKYKRLKAENSILKKKNEALLAKSLQFDKEAINSSLAKTTLKTQINKG